MADAPLPTVPLALKSRLSELEGLWVEVRCGQCGRSSHSPGALLAGRHGPHHQLGAILARMVCSRCRVPPGEAWLNQTHNRQRNGGAEPGLSIRLI